MRLLDGKPWVHSTATDVRGVLKAHGHVAPEARANEAEASSRTEGAFRAMRAIQAEAGSAAANVTAIKRRKAAK